MGKRYLNFRCDLKMIQPKAPSYGTNTEKNTKNGPSATGF